MENNTINFLIISDLHCCKNKSGLSHVHCEMLDKPIERNPIESFKQVIKKEKLKADYVLCLGDITDKADRAGFLAGKRLIESLHREIEAKELLYVTGNHDVDPCNISNSQNHDYQSVPKAVNDYPLPSRHDLLPKYWSDQFCLFEDDNAVILLINTAHYLTDKNKLSISPFFTNNTLDSIKQSISKVSNSAKVKIALCHHHPIQHCDFDDEYTSNDLINRGAILINHLKEAILIF